MYNPNKKRFIYFSLTFMITFLLCLFATFAYVQSISKLDKSQMENLLTTRASKVSRVISDLLYKTEILSALVIQTNGDIADFSKVASTIIDDPAIKNVLIAPNGIVSHVYPLEGNETLIGFDFFSENDGNKEAIVARESGQLVLGGPFNLMQGGQAIVGRLPIYMKNENNEEVFWGLVSITLNYPDALAAAELEQLKEQGYAYEIWRISPDTGKKQIIANSSYAYNQDTPYVEQKIHIANAEWYFKLSPIKHWYEYPETWILTFGGIFISLLVALLVLHNYELGQLKLELEDLTTKDSLTGILNRRGLLFELEKLVTYPNQKFVLCFMDLNKFKLINDTLGHSFGDKLLQQFAETFKQHIDKQHIFARIGGDEFILVFKNTDDDKHIDDFFTKIQKALTDTVRFPSNAIINNITFTMGKSVFPRDGITIDELLHFADNKMYANKHRV